MKKYFKNNVEVGSYTFENELEQECRYFIENNFDDIVDEMFGDVVLGDLVFTASDVLWRCDKASYNKIFNEELQDFIRDCWNDLNDGRELRFDDNVYKIVKEVE